MATNEEKLVSAFQEKVAIISSFNVANFGSKQFQNCGLAAILSNFVIIKTK